MFSRIATSTTKISSIGSATAILFALTVLPASAQTLNTSVSASSTIGGSGVNVSANASAKLADIIKKADADIAARITSLNNLSARVAEIKNVSATVKASIASEVQTNITGLTTLK